MLGNITSLTRTGTFSLPDVSGSFSYDYGSSGSRLHSVTNGLGYSRQYVYSSMGSMSSDGLVQYAYNELGLPKSVTGSAHMSDISYLYDFRGRKLSYVSGLGVRDYVNGIEYLGSDLDFIHMSNGIARRAGSGYSYSFFLKDHLGSIRLVHDASGSVVQQMDYLPFGLEVPRKISSPKLDYSYNGKEFQSGINKYDYGARLYDPVIGRWNVVDPLAEVMPSLSPYSFVFNNPINFIDPDGRIPYPITIRSFAADKWFGLGFHGDNRGFSNTRSYPNGQGPTARVHQVINFDTDKSTISARVWSSKTYHRGAPFIKRTATPSLEFTDGFKMRTSADAKTFMFGTHSKGANPLVINSPNIDVFSDFSITENKKAGTLDISGTLTGDNFPSTKAFISDPSGQNVFLGIGFYEGSPFSSLDGENKRPITDFNFSITTDKKGNFTGVKLGGTNYSIQDWNKMFETTDPHKKRE